MEVYETIQKRRSIRKFSNKPVDRETIEKLLTAATLAPSGKNGQPWRFVVLTGESKKTLCGMLDEAENYCQNAGIPTFSLMYTVKSISEAPVCILVFNAEGKAEGLPQGIDAYKAIMEIQSVGAAIENICLAACEMDLGTLWICDVFYAAPAIAQWLKRSDQLIAAISVGYPTESPNARPRRKPSEVAVWMD